MEGENAVEEDGKFGTWRGKGERIKGKKGGVKEGKKTRINQQNIGKSWVLMGVGCVEIRFCGRWVED